MNIENIHIENNIHNLQSQGGYNLFGTQNQFLSQAFLTSPGIVEITFSAIPTSQNNEIELWMWDYNTIDKFGHFGKSFVEKIKIEKTDLTTNIHISNWDHSKNYLIKFQNEWATVFLDPTLGGILDTHFAATEERNFGVRINKELATFTVWSPPAAHIELLLYDKNQKQIATGNRLWMQKSENGVFSLTISPEISTEIGSFNGLYYQYLVFAYGKAALALDPYCYSMASFNPNGDDKIGKGAIISMGDEQSIPEKFSKNYLNSRFMANETDLIAYEAHVRDFTIQPGTVKSEIAGTYLGAISKIDHLKQLGISHLQLLPVMNFYTVNENDRSFSASDALQSNYNWGYDPHHYFSLEGWFSTDAQNPYTRIREFRTLVQSLHDKGIGLIIDVVYNHTYLVETFENIAPGCYYRLTSNLTISGHTGAGFTMECRRKMVRKLILDSLKFFVKEYHIDGFRFDLMGFMDHETMRMIRKEVGMEYNPNNPNDLILHGEAWVFSDLDTTDKSSGENAATTKINYPSEDLNIGFFNDTTRDSFAGTPKTLGFIQGNFSEIDRVASGIVGGLKGINPGAVSFNDTAFRNGYNLFAIHPSNCLNFLSVHDGMTLWDKINLHCFDSTGQQRARLMRFASAMLFTSQGKIILHGGDEVLRTKPLSNVDKEKHRAFTSHHTNEEEGACHFHENTYCSNDFTNMIRWSRLHNQYAPIARQMVDYYKGLILMRRSIPALRLNNGTSLRKAFKFIPSTPFIETKIPAIFSDFKDKNLEQLTLKFIHGKANASCYLIGEIHPKGIDINPTTNPYIVHLDTVGEGKISFNRSKIEQFDLGKWGDGISLNIKLVLTPGKWDTLPTSYTSEGKNVIMIQGIPQNGEVTIDLSIENHWVGITPKHIEPWIAYLIDNTLEDDVASHVPKTDFKQILVIHNAADVTSEVTVETLEIPSEWSVILDANHAGITPLEYAPKPMRGETDVLILKGKVLVPAKSSAVLVR
jgi:pullulanase